MSSQFRIHNWWYKNFELNKLCRKEDSMEDAKKIDGQTG